MKLSHILILSILLFSLIAGCVEQTKADSGRITYIDSFTTEKGNDVEIYHDNIDNTTIYIFYGYGGVSAVPDYQLNKPANHTEV